MNFCVRECFLSYEKAPVSINEQMANYIKIYIFQRFINEKGTHQKMVHELVYTHK